MPKPCPSALRRLKKHRAEEKKRLEKQSSPTAVAVEAVKTFGNEQQDGQGQQDALVTEYVVEYPTDMPEFYKNYFVPLKRGDDEDDDDNDEKRGEGTEPVKEGAQQRHPIGHKVTGESRKAADRDNNDDDKDDGSSSYASGMSDVESSRDAPSQSQAPHGAPTAPVSRKKLKLLTRISLAHLKTLARRPEVVEWEDVTAKDPEFLVFLKSYRNHVPVPKHWSRKRKYLAGKRGFVKPPFELPAFIRDTGITEARDQARRKDSSKTLKVRAREKMRPKLGKLSVDYQKLYDAFFKYQTKPPLTMQGDLYYEGREFEQKFKDKRPGFLSDEARLALGMAPLSCPPWLYNQQRLGAPPSYPSLKIPGLNAPIPEGAQWGYHAGGWGKPPVDDTTKPIFEGASNDPRELKTRDRWLRRAVDEGPWGGFEAEPGRGRRGQLDGVGVIFSS